MRKNPPEGNFPGSDPSKLVTRPDDRAGEVRTETMKVFQIIAFAATVAVGTAIIFAML